MALPMTPDRADIGAVVLVDSAPINDMHSIAEIEDTVLTPYLELIQQNNSDGLYRKYINQKR